MSGALQPYVNAGPLEPDARAVWHNNQYRCKCTHACNALRASTHATRTLIARPDSGLMMYPERTSGLTLATPPPPSPPAAIEEVADCCVCRESTPGKGID